MFYGFTAPYVFFLDIKNKKACMEGQFKVALSEIFLFKSPLGSKPEKINKLTFILGVLCVCINMYVYQYAIPDSNIDTYHNTRKLTIILNANLTDRLQGISSHSTAEMYRLLWFLLFRINTCIMQKLFGVLAPSPPPPPPTIITCPTCHWHALSVVTVVEM